MFRSVRARLDMLIIPAIVAPYPKEAALPGAARDRCPVPMMIDTGARFSLVTDTVLAQLGVVSIGDTDVRTSLQSVELRPVYRIAVGIEGEDMYGNPHFKSVPLSVIASPPVTVMISPNIPLHHEGLLGLDFLQDFRFAYDGPTGEFRLSW
jgi:hypothetical protein